MTQQAGNICRRCGRSSEELYQMLDNGGRWAVVCGTCTCGHTWTVIHTAVPNLSALRAWLRRGGQPPEGPLGPMQGGPWQSWRVEGFALEPVHSPGR